GDGGGTLAHSGDGGAVHGGNSDVVTLQHHTGGIQSVALVVGAAHSGGDGAAHLHHAAAEGQLHLRLHLVQHPHLFGGGYVHLAVGISAGAQVAVVVLEGVAAIHLGNGPLLVG